MSVRGTRKFPLYLVGLLTVINAGFFLRKDFFEYKPYAEESALYAPASGNWNRFFTDFPREGRGLARLFTDSLLKGRDTARLAQIKQIGSFLYGKFSKQLGKPTVNDQLQDPWDMYRFFAADSSRTLWCGHLSMMFNYFCLARGIETRMIEIMKPGDHHVVNECYLPAIQQWVLVDITYNQLLVSEENGMPVGLTSFRRMQGRNINLKVQAANDSVRLLRPDTGYVRNYYNTGDPAYYYHTINPKVVYQTSEKIRRYFLPESWYQILATEPTSNFLFYLKQGLALAWLLSLIFLLYRWISWKRK